MNIEDIRDYCISKAGAVEELPFGPDFLVFKVGGKMFLLVGLNQFNSLSFNVKCDPEYAEELRVMYPETVIPGYHMNKKHWNTVYCNKELGDARLQDFIDDSYLLILKSLPQRLRQSILEK